VLCQVNLKDVTADEREILDAFFFHPYDKLEEIDGALMMNYMGGKLCLGTNDFSEACGLCRYMPVVVRKILKRQTEFTFGKEA